MSFEDLFDEKDNIKLDRKVRFERDRLKQVFSCFDDAIEGRASESQIKKLEDDAKELFVAYELFLEKYYWYVEDKVKCDASKYYGICDEKASSGLKFERQNEGYYVVGIGSCSDEDIVIPSKVNDVNVIGIAEAAFEDCGYNVRSMVIPGTIARIGREALPEYGECDILYLGTEEEWSKIGIDRCNRCETTYTVFFYSECAPMRVGWYWRFDQNHDVEIFDTDRYPDRTAGELIRAANDIVSAQIRLIDKFHWPSCREEDDELVVTGIGNCFGAEVRVPDRKDNKLITGIDDCAFKGYSKIVRVSLPSHLSSIGNAAFLDCECLEDILLPHGLSFIGAMAFKNCISLKDIFIPVGLTSIEDETFYGCKNLIELKVPDGTKSIGARAMYGCESLYSIKISRHLTSIGEAAFYGCKSVTCMSIPQNVTAIGAYAFSGCEAIKQLTIPNKIDTIHDGTFENCESLRSVVIPKKVKFIGKDAFLNCGRLETVFYFGNENEWNEVAIQKGNEVLSGKVIFYSETASEKEGSYWHYRNDRFPVRW